MDKKVLSAVIALFAIWSAAAISVNAEQASLEKAYSEADEVIYDQLEVTERIAENQSNSERSDEGKAYAIFCENGELVFLRSDEMYKNGETVIAEDITGNTYDGIVYADIESLYCSSPDKVPWKEHRSKITTVYVADGQIIKPHDFDYWFYYCSSLKSADLDGFDTSTVSSICCSIGTGQNRFLLYEKTEQGIN